jgi:hypothetical protein
MCKNHEVIFFNNGSMEDLKPIQEMSAEPYLQKEDVGDF